MKSLAIRQAEREKRKAEEAEARKVSGLDIGDDETEAGDEETGEGRKPKKGRSGVTKLADAGIDGGAGGAPQGGNGGGVSNPFGK